MESKVKNILVSCICLSIFSAIQSTEEMNNQILAVVNQHTEQFNIMDERIANVTQQLN